MKTVKVMRASSMYGKGGARIPNANLQINRQQAAQLVKVAKAAGKLNAGDLRLLAVMMFAR
jgi:hypothetical protein